MTVRLGTSVAQTETILIAVNDGVLADSLRFSLELEGFETRFCDETSLLSTMTAPGGCARCLVLDHDVFLRVVDEAKESPFAGRGLPVILMVSSNTKRVRERAAAAGVTEMIEKPLLGGVLLDAIRHAIAAERSGRPLRPV